MLTSRCVGLFKYIYRNVLSVLFVIYKPSGYVIFFADVNGEMKVSKTGYSPLFYKNEPITIECTATEYTVSVAFHIRDRVSTARQHGCSNPGGDHSPNNGLLQLAFPNRTKKICESLLQPTTPPSILSVTGTVNICSFKSTTLLFWS